MQRRGTSKRETRVRDAAPESRGRTPAGLEFRNHAQDEIEAVRRAAVGETLLGESPHALVGVEFGRVGGQELEVKPWDAAAQLLHPLAAVDAEPVPDEDHRPTQVTE